MDDNQVVVRPVSNLAEGRQVRCVLCKRLLTDAYLGLFDTNGLPVCEDRQTCERRGVQHEANIGIVVNQPEGRTAHQGTVVREQYTTAAGTGTLFMLLTPPLDDGVNLEGQRTAEPICPHCVHVGGHEDGWVVKDGVYYHTTCGPVSEADLAMFYYKFGPK